MQNVKRGGFRIAKQEKTQEQIEYEDATKNLKALTTKLKLSQQGVDTSSISRQDLDRVMALFDKMDAISADVRNKTAEIQKESSVEIQKINQRANEKYTQVSKEIDSLINKMKKVEVTEPVIEQVDLSEEKIEDKNTKEEIINAATARITEKTRKEIINAFEEMEKIRKDVIDSHKEMVNDDTIIHSVEINQRDKLDTGDMIAANPEMTIEEEIIKKE